MAVCGLSHSGVCVCTRVFVCALRCARAQVCVCVCAQVLDRLLLYLRLVHSVDYYNFCEYPAEDEMPHRCGLIHVRGALPLGKVTPAEGTHTHTHTHASVGGARACGGPAV